MKYRDYNVQLTKKIVNDYVKLIVELKSNNDYIFYLNDNLNLISVTKLLDTKNGYKTLVKQLKLIVDKRIVEKTIFNL